MKKVIHFTSKFENLKSILTSSSLKLHYCKEDFCLGNKEISRAVHPMVSFSEYDIDKIDNENITYGKFGIAYNDSWVNKNKIHPVLYIDNNSIIAESLAHLLIARRKNAKKQLSENVRLSIMTLKCFTKNSIGYNSHFKKPNFNFKAENEWRFVPTKKQIGQKLISQDRSKYLKDDNRYNKSLEPYPLKFTLKDIDFIFVENEEQRTEIQKNFFIDINKILISSWKKSN